MNRKQYIKLVILLFASWVLLNTSCKVGKEYTQPELNMPNKIEARSIDSLTIDDLHWWELYTDTVLQALIDTALKNNNDLLIATARLKQYMAAKQVANADFFPQAELGIHGEKEGDNYGGNNRQVADEFSVVASMTWEIDLWGNIRWGKEAALADYLASAEARRSIQMSIVAEVAEVYFTLIALDEELRIINNTADSRREGVRIANLRFQGGLTSETSAQQARVELANTLTLIPKIETQINAAQNQLALLMGEFDNTIVRGKRISEQEIPDELPAGLPSELLIRRPDIQEAEQKLISANAMLGVAVTNRFPRLFLTGSYGRENSDLTNLLKSPYWFLAGDILGPLFTAGKLKNEQKIAESLYEQEIYRYQQSVLQAFHEANNAIVGFRKTKDIFHATEIFENATSEYNRLAQIQYMNGAISYLDLLDAQRNLFNAELELNNAKRDELISMVQLYKSLGGGWEK